MNIKTIPLRAWYATLALGCYGLVAIGMIIQEMDKLSPCPMCIAQRFDYLVIGTIALIAFVLPKLNFIWWRLIALLSLVGIGIAGVQTWMQAFPEQASECGYNKPNLLEQFVDWLGSVNPELFLATGFCASRDWTFLGLSMANWSVIVFLAIIMYAFKVLRTAK